MYFNNRNFTQENEDPIVSYTKYTANRTGPINLNIKNEIKDPNTDNLNYPNTFLSPIYNGDYSYYSKNDNDEENLIPDSNAYTVGEKPKCYSVDRTERILGKGMNAVIKIPIYGKKNSVKEFDLINSEIVTRTIMNPCEEEIQRGKYNSHQCKMQNRSGSCYCNCSKSSEKTKQRDQIDRVHTDEGKIDLSNIRFVTLRKFCINKFYKLKRENNDKDEEEEVYEYSKTFRGFYSPPKKNNLMTLMSYDMRKKIAVQNLHTYTYFTHEDNKIITNNQIKDLTDNQNNNPTSNSDVKDGDLNPIKAIQIVENTLPSKDDIDSFFEDKLYEHYDHLDDNDEFDNKINNSSYNNHNRLNLDKYLNMKPKKESEEENHKKSINKSYTGINTPNRLNPPNHPVPKITVTPANRTTLHNTGSFVNKNKSLSKKASENLDKLEKKVSQTPNRNNLVNNILYNYRYSNNNNEKTPPGHKAYKVNLIKSGLLEKIKNKHNLKDFDQFNDYSNNGDDSGIQFPPKFNNLINRTTNNAAQKNLNYNFNGDIRKNESRNNKSAKANLNKLILPSYDLVNFEKLSTKTNESQLKTTIRTTGLNKASMDNNIQNESKYKLFFNLEEEFKDPLIDKPEKVKSLFPYQQAHKKIPLISPQKRFFLPNSGLYCNIYPSNEIDYLKTKYDSKPNIQLYSHLKY